MDSKKPNRRRFLKQAPRWPAWPWEPDGRLPTARLRSWSSPFRSTPKSLKELIAYGERSHFVTSVRVPVAERPSPDAFGLTFHVLTPLQDSVGNHHAILAPLCGYPPWLLCSGHRSQGASPA